MRVEGVEEVERVGARVVDEVEERLEALRRDRRLLQVQLRQQPPREVGHELRAGGEGVVLLAGHAHHLAALVLEEREEARRAVEVGDAGVLVHARQPVPRVLARVGPKHGMHAQQVAVGGHGLRHHGLGVLLH